MKNLKKEYNVDSIATKIAAAILLKDKKISVADIRAIPLIESDEQAMMIARNLTQLFDVEIEQVKAMPGSSKWVNLLRLKSIQPTHLAASTLK